MSAARITARLLHGFVALTATGGGLALATGIDPFPLAWLEGTPFASYLVLSQALRGAGDPRWPMFLTYFSTYCVRVPLAYVIGLKLGYGIAGVWIALSTELTVRGILFMLRFQFGNWERTRV